MNRVGLYLGFPPEGGGAFQYAQSILGALAELPPDTYEIVVAYTHPAWSGKLAPYQSRIEWLSLEEGVTGALIEKFLRAGFPLAWWRFLAPRMHALTRRLVRTGCDLWIFPAQEVWAYAIPLPTLGVIHDLMHRYESRFPEVSAFGIYHRRERHYRNSCYQTRGVLVDSDVGKRQVIESFGVSADRVHVLPFVAPGYMYSSEPPPSESEARYKLPDSFIFYPAQFWKHKNHIRLLEAFAIARRSVPDLHLVLSGSQKNAYKEVVKRISELALEDRVHLLGYVPDEYMPWLYRRARALVFPTFFGPTNIPPLEALVAGSPMAVSDIYAMPAQVGRAALLFDPTSVDEIANAIIRLATDDALCQHLQQAARVKVGRWNQSAFNERLRTILESVLGS